MQISNKVVKQIDKISVIYMIYDATIEIYRRW